jgi:hypothetical protein
MIKTRYENRIKLARDTNAPYGVGAWKAHNILLVGEQAANPSINSEQQPFCSEHGCSGWLNNKLEEAGIPEEKLFWVNALNNDGSPANLRTINHILQPKAIIALGKVAEKHCNEFFVPFTYVPHPQYWKRFKYSIEYPLIKILKDLLKEEKYSKTNIVDINRSRLNHVGLVR